MISGIQVLGLLFGIGIIYLSYVYYRRKDFSLTDFLIWVLIGICVLYPTIFPESLEFLVQPLSFYRPFDFLTMGGLIIALVITFRIYRVTRKNERNLDEIVRNLALRGSKSKKK